MSNQKPSSPKSIPPTLQTLKARQLYEKRLKEGRDGNAEQDWEEAQQYLLDHPQAIFLWRLKQGVFRSVDASGTGFKTFINFFWKGLPTSEWVKLLATPIVLSIAGALITNYFQEQSRQNEIVNKYFEQMQQLIVDKKIDFAKSKDSVKTLIKGKSLATLRSVDNSRKEIVLSFLSESDLLNSRKQGISLSYFNLEQINLSGFNLTGINLKNAVLVKANLKGSLLEQADFSNANLIDANLIDANLSGANLSGVNLSGVNLGGVNLSGAILSGAILTRANLSEANLSGAILTHAILTRADLSGAILTRAILTRANLSDANLSGAILTHATLARANLSGAILTRADLSGAILTRANLSGANLSGAQNSPREQIKLACNWETALYTESTWNNQKVIDDMKQHKDSNPPIPPDCSTVSP